MRLILSLLALLFLVASSVSAEHSVIKIGVITAQTGPLGLIGTTIRNAFMLAERRLAPKGDVTFVFEDDGFLPRNAVVAAQKLLLDPDIKALVVFGGSTSQAVAQITNQKRVPLAALTVLDSITEQGENTFQFFVSSSEMNQVTAAEMERRGIKTIAVVATQHDATLFQRDQFLSIFPGKVLLSFDLLPGDLDLRTIVSKISASKPDAVFAFAIPPQGSTFAKQLRRGGFSGQLVASLQIGAPSEVENAEGSTIGAFYACGDDRGAGEFHADYRASFPDSTPFSETVFGYDTAQLLIAGARSGDISHYLRTVKDFPGVLGNLGATGNRSFTFGAALKEITGEGPRFLN